MVTTNTTKALIQRFYGEIWNSQDSSSIDQILATELSFRGSLGNQLMGIPAFLEYVDSVHAGLSNYHCEIKSMVIDQDRAAARMLFSGIHNSEFMGFAPTGSDVSWNGAAFFEIREQRIYSIWVLGDLKSLYDQLAY